MLPNRSALRETFSVRARDGRVLFNQTSFVCYITTKLDSYMAFTGRLVKVLGMSSPRPGAVSIRGKFASNSVQRSALECHDLISNNSSEIPTLAGLAMFFMAIRRKA